MLAKLLSRPSSSPVACEGSRATWTPFGHSRGRWFLLRVEHLECLLTGDNRKMTNIKGQHRATASFCAGNDGGVGESQRQICIALNELADANEIWLLVIDQIRLLQHIVEKRGKNVVPKPLFDQIRNLRQYESRND